MKKLLLIFCITYMQIKCYSQMFESFESTTGPTSANWSLNSGIWKVANNSQSNLFWTVNDSPNVVFSGTNSAYMNRYYIGAGNYSSDYLISPLVYIPYNGRIKFWSRTFTSDDQGTLFKVKILPSNYQISQIPSYPAEVTYNETNLSQTYNVYEQKFLEIPFYSGQYVHIVFERYHHQTTTVISGDRWLLDDVSVTCFNPAPIAYNQTFCNFATVADLNATGTNIKWYLNENSGVELPLTTELVNNTTYYVSQTVSDCESVRVPIYVTIQHTGPPIGPQIQYYNFGDILVHLNVQGNNITWYSSIYNAINHINHISEVSVMQNGTTYYANQKINNCESETPLAITVYEYGLNTLSIEKKKNITIPNPSSSTINLQLANEEIIDTIIITDLTGKIIINQKQNNINIQNLEKGIYFIELYSNEKRYQTKFIKK